MLGVLWPLLRTGRTEAVGEVAEGEKGDVTPFEVTVLEPALVSTGDNGARDSEALMVGEPRASQATKQTSRQAKKRRKEASNEGGRCD